MCVLLVSHADMEHCYFAWQFPHTLYVMTVKTMAVSQWYSTSGVKNIIAPGTNMIPVIQPLGINVID